VVLARVLGMGLLMALFCCRRCLFPAGLACLRTIETRTECAGRYYYGTPWLGDRILARWFSVAIPAIGALPLRSPWPCCAALAALTVFLVLARKSQNRRVAAVGGLAAVAVLVIVPLVVPAQLRSIRPDERSVTRVEDEWGVFR